VGRTSKREFFKLNQKTIDEKEDQSGIIVTYDGCRSLPISKHRVKCCRFVKKNKSVKKKKKERNPSEKHRKGRSLSLDLTVIIAGGRPIKKGQAEELGV
jgi:hypothetical protein